MYIYICTYMYICIYVCMYVCTYMCTYIYIYMYTYKVTTNTELHANLNSGHFYFRVFTLYVTDLVILVGFGTVMAFKTHL